LTVGEFADKFNFTNALFKEIPMSDFSVCSFCHSGSDKVGKLIASNVSTAHLCKGCAERVLEQLVERHVRSSMENEGEVAPRDDLPIEIRRQVDAGLHGKFIEGDVGVDLVNLDVDSGVLNLLPRETCEALSVVPVELNRSVLRVAISSRDRADQAAEHLKFLTGLNISFILCSKTDIDNAINRHQSVWLHGSGDYDVNSQGG
jgi:hypothetical protein